jgi:DNA-binding PucR family transcriptional regulator
LSESTRLQPTIGLPLVDQATLSACTHVADRLELEADDLAEQMTDLVLEEIAEYSALGSPAVRQGVLEHSRDHVKAVIRSIRSWSLPKQTELAFVRERGALRATQQLPLSALLHSYRLGHRVVWQRLVRLLEGSDDVLQSSLALTSLTLAYTEQISSALAEGYTERQRLLLLQIDRDRRDLLERILRGTFDRRSDTARAASQFALVPGGDYLVVVVSDSSTSTESLNGETLTHAAETLRRHFALGVAQPFVVVRHAEVVCVLPLARARAAALVHLTRQSLAQLRERGQRWHAGISTVCAGLAEVSRGYQEALLAADLATATSETPVCALLELRVSEYLLARADVTATRMIPTAWRQLCESPHPDDRALVETLVAYLKADLSVAATAERLAVHPNTVSYRLRKAAQRLDRDLSRFSDLVEVLTWIRIWATHG